MVQVVKDYKRTAAGEAYDPTKFVVSPITGELVPLAEMQEHMRINLIDPKWKDQREAMLAKIKETTKASDSEIMSNLTHLAGTRPDVFGSDVRELSSVLPPEPGTLPKDGPAGAPKPAPKPGAPPTLAPLPAAPAGVAMAPPPPRGLMPPPGVPPMPPAKRPLPPPSPDPKKPKTS